MSNQVVVVLKQGWMGHPKGTELRLFRHKADEMIHRGIAKEKEDEVVEIKSMEKPPKHRMLRRSTTK